MKGSGKLKGSERERERERERDQEKQRKEEVKGRVKCVHSLKGETGTEINNFAETVLLETKNHLLMNDEGNAGHSSGVKR